MKTFVLLKIIPIGSYFEIFSLVSKKFLQLTFCLLVYVAISCVAILDPVPNLR